MCASLVTGSADLLIILILYFESTIVTIVTIVTIPVDTLIISKWVTAA